MQSSDSVLREKMYFRPVPKDLPKNGEVGLRLASMHNDMTEVLDG